MKNALHKFRQFMNQKPLIGVVSVILIFTLHLSVGNAIVRHFGHWLLTCFCENLPFGGNILKNIYLAFIANIREPLLAFLMVWLFGYTYIYKRKGFFQTLKFGFLDIISIILFLCSSIYFIIIQKQLQFKAPWSIVNIIFHNLIFYFEDSFYQDSFFVGLILNSCMNAFSKTRKGVWLSIVLTGLVFGFAHTGIVFNFKHHTSLIEFCNALFLILDGIYVCAYYLRGGSIWAVTFLHTLFNFVQDLPLNFFVRDSKFWEIFESTNWSISEIIYRTVILITYGLITLFLLRKSKINETVQNFNTWSNLKPKTRLAH